MQFATVCLTTDTIHLFAFEKEYNRTVATGYTAVALSDAVEILNQFDFVDVVLPPHELFYFVKQYPPVKLSQLDKVIYQDIAIETPFDPTQLLICHTAEYTTEGKRLVMAVNKQRIGNLIKQLGTEFQDKVRRIIPPHLLLFRSTENKQGVFIGDSYTVVAGAEGQVVVGGGLLNLYEYLRSHFTDMNDTEYDSWLSTLGDISSVDDLSPDDLRARALIKRWFGELVQRIRPWLPEVVPTEWFFCGSVPGNGEAVLLETVHSNSAIVDMEELLDRLSAEMTKSNDLNFAKEEFVYRGGIQFLRIRLVVALVLLLFVFIGTVVAMQIRLSSLHALSDTIDSKNRKITKEILGKEYPSLRQAIAVMKKTISGENNKDTKALYPYSATFIMEKIFPLIAFENSTIEIRDFSVREGGKVRISGDSDTLDDINTMVAAIEGLDEVADVSKGQITSRKGKNRFNISFEFSPKKPSAKSDKRRKGGTKK